MNRTFDKRQTLLRAYRVFADKRSPRPHVERVTSGAVKLPQITPYALADAQAAHRVSEGRHLRGRLVFKVHD